MWILNTSAVYSQPTGIVGSVSHKYMQPECDHEIHHDVIIVGFKSVTRYLGFVPRKEANNDRNPSIGRFVPGKGIEYPICAFSLLIKERPDLGLLMIRNGPLKENTGRKMRDKDLRRNTTIKDFILNLELPMVCQLSKVVFNMDSAQRFGGRGRAKAVKDYSWRDTIGKTTELYEGVSCQKQQA